MTSSLHNKKLSFIDLFCGAGGFSKGLEMSGMKCMASLDNNKHCIETHKQNFLTCKSLLGDIEELSPEKFSKLTKVKKIDLIVGGPPCPTFSTLGEPKINSLNKLKNIIEDKRNFLFRNFFNYIQFYKPNFFIMENVPTFITKYKGEIYKQTLDLIKEIGYTISKRQVKVLNAENFGVPQNRRRMFLVGHKKKFKYEYPNITHLDCSSDLFSNNYKKIVTVHDALSDLPIITDNWRVSESEYSKNKSLTEYQLIMRKKNKSKYVMNNICRLTNDRDKKIFNVMAQGSKYKDLPVKYKKMLPYREDIFDDKLKRLDNSKPSWTVVAHIGMDGYMYIHPTENRTLSVREAARLQSFPDDFIFKGTQHATYHMVGNAVPPLVAKALGHSIINSVKKS